MIDPAILRSTRGLEQLGTWTMFMELDTAAVQSTLKTPLRPLHTFDTTSLTGGEWIIVLALSLIAPAVVAVDKVIQVSRQRKTNAEKREASSPGLRSMHASA